MNVKAPSTDEALNEFQQQKVLEFMKLTKWMVTRIVRRLPQHIEADDLVHSGILGLIDAVRKFHWGRPNEAEEFKAYANCRIRGQIMDELRHMDCLPRSTRDRVKQLRKAYDQLRQTLQHEPSDEEVRLNLHIDQETLDRLKSDAGLGIMISIDSGTFHDDLEDTLQKAISAAASLPTPEGIVHRTEIKSIIAQEIDHLNEQERQVISLYYLEELTLKEIGEVLSVTESRISQIHSKATAKLAKRLKTALNLEVSRGISL